MTLIEAAKLAIDAAKNDDPSRVIELLTKAIEQAEQAQPFAEIRLNMTGGNAGLSTHIVQLAEGYYPAGTKLYTTPPPRQPEQEPDDLHIAYMSGLHRGKELAQRQPLTDERLRDVLKDTNHMIRNAMHGPFWPELEQACRAIEAAHGIKEKNT